MFSNLDNGDTLAIGQACMLTFALSTAAELAGMLAPDQREQYDDLIDKLNTAIGRHPAELKSAPEPPKRPRGRPRKVHIDHGEQGVNLPPEPPIWSATVDAPEATA